MKIYSVILSFIIVALLGTACTRKVYVYKPLPPGQAKKITGEKSAKRYAPGQQKKRVR